MAGVPPFICGTPMAKWCTVSTAYFSMAHITVAHFTMAEIYSGPFHRLQLRLPLLERLK